MQREAQSQGTSPLPTYQQQTPFHLQLQYLPSFIFLSPVLQWCWPIVLFGIPLQAHTMSFDRSHPKRQRLEFARPDHVYSAQPFNGDLCSKYYQEPLTGVHDSHPSTIINVPRSRTTPEIEAETTVCYGMVTIYHSLFYYIQVLTV